MAIARGAGTEIIRTATFEDISDGGAGRNLIIGVQHHIYTVLSITAFCISRAGTQNGNIRIKGFDAFAGVSAQTHIIAYVGIAVGETFVWNDKFSFNGYEPDWSGHSGQMTTAAEQDAIADQGGSVPQYLLFDTDSASTVFDVSVTYIDQNNA